MRWRWPWKTRQQLRRVVTGLTHELADRERRISELCKTARQDTATIAFLEGEMRRLAGTERGAMLSTQRPDWVLVGIPRGPAGVRVWASRELAGTAFDMTPMDQPPPRWVIKATMAQALTVDEPDYGAAMAKITEIWRNWDAEAARTEARAHAVPKPAITRGQAAISGRAVVPACTCGAAGRNRERRPGERNEIHQASCPARQAVMLPPS